MEQTIEDIYRTGSVVGRSGQVHKLHSAIDPEEGKFLSSLIQNDPSIRRTLEVGCAFGLSSLHICTAMRDRSEASHTIIDPFQSTDWDGAGIRGLESVGIDFFTLIEAKSEIALPQLLKENEGQFDFVFIDGWHTFDQTMLDCYYATRLLRVGGVLALDDVKFPAVRRVVNFLRNFPCYKEHASVSRKIPMTWKRTILRSLTWPLSRTVWEKILSASVHQRIYDDRSTKMIALRKTQEDNRNWNWHIDQF